MNTSNIFDTYVEEYEKWYEQYPHIYQSEILALREQLAKLPENIQGIEVGLGTGRFAKPLGIKEGIEPSEAMAAIARERGIEVMDGVAEFLPYADMHFDFVLFVTVCHLKNLKSALKEAYRVLKPNGGLLVGFLDKDRAIAQEYISKRNRSIFYAQATFYTVKKLDSLVREVGFRNLEYNQTLFGNIDSIQELQHPQPGSGEGSFVVLKATKK